MQVLRTGAELLIMRCLELGALALVLLATLASTARASGETVRVGVYQNSPKIFLSEGRISGIFGDLLDQIAAEEDWTIVPVPCQWNECLQMVEDGRIDIMPDVAFSDQRAEQLRFGEVPALYGWSVLYRRPGTDLQTINDLAGKRVAVLSGSIQESYLQEMVRDYGLRNVRFVAADSLEQAFQITADNKADAVASNNFFGNPAALDYRLKSTTIFFQPAPLFFAASSDQPGAGLLAAIDGHLSAWEADPASSYYDILSKWNVSTKEKVVPVYVWWAIAGLLALLVLAALLSWVLRRDVIRKTQSLVLAEHRHGLILDSLDACIYIKDRDLRYQYVNKSLADQLGLPVSQIVGKSADELVDAETAALLREGDELVLRDDDRITTEEVLKSPDGEIRTYLSVKQPLRDAAGKTYGVCGISTDFTERKRHEEQVRHLALYDALTGLPNRSLLLDRATQALENHARNQSNGALLFIDLDEFKILNDTLGHVQGDRLLQLVAERLNRHVGDAGMLAHLGGDEFVLLVEDLGANCDQASRRISDIADKVLRAFADEPYRLDHSTHRVSVSIGIALFTDASQHVEELLKRADVAMYAAKSAGRNQFKFFDPQMQARLGERAELEAALHEALQLDQFSLAYQPQVTSAGEVFGAEALIRWNHPAKGQISPGAFIPLAESTGQIIPLGNWVFREACRQIAIWQKSPAHRHLSLSVNVSARQFREPDFVSNLIGILDETGADPSCLDLELTESVLTHDIEALIDKMKELKALGIHFSLDDFGTGYSSLSYLKRLPLDRLKIDQSFVRDLLTDANGAVIVRTILALGQSLNLAVVAEGVETEAQCSALIGLGCTRLQGYLFGRPGPSDSLLSHSGSYEALGRIHTA